MKWKWVQEEWNQPAKNIQRNIYYGQIRPPASHVLYVIVVLASSVRRCRCRRCCCSPKTRQELGRCYGDALLREQTDTHTRSQAILSIYTQKKKRPGQNLYRSSSECLRSALVAPHRTILALATKSTNEPPIPNSRHTGMIPKLGQLHITHTTDYSFHIVQST